MSSDVQLLEAAGRRRSPARLPDFHAGRAPANKGRRYAADPPTVDEIIVIMRVARNAPCGDRLNGLIVVLWRAGLRIHEALSLTETDLEQRRGSILVRHGTNDRCRSARCSAALAAGVRRRVAPHELRHARAVELLHEGIALPLIQRQLGHSHLSMQAPAPPRGKGGSTREPWRPRRRRAHLLASLGSFARGRTGPAFVCPRGYFAAAGSVAAHVR